MDIEKLIEQAHNQAVKSGFYDCGCDYGCELCKNTRHYADVGERLMLIVCELAEAIEAHRNNKTVSALHNRCRGFLNGYNIDKEANVDFLTKYIELSKEKESVNYGHDTFKNYYKDTFEDELADVFIRLFDLCGYLGCSLKDFGPYDDFSEIKNIPSRLYRTIKLMPVYYYEHNVNNDELSMFYTSMLWFCKEYHIDIEKHIYAKMVYNKTREYKHGKMY